MDTLIERITLIDKNGKQYTANIHEERANAKDHDDPLDVLPNLKRCRLVDGSDLNRVDENTFKNIHTGELLYRVKKLR